MAGSTMRVDVCKNLRRRHDIAGVLLCAVQHKDEAQPCCTQRTCSPEQLSKAPPALTVNSSINR